MNKKYIQTIMTIAVLCIIGSKSANAQDQETENKSMQTRSYAIPEDLKKQMIDNIKKNRGVTEDSEKNDADSANDNDENNKQAEAEVSEAHTQKKPNAQKKIWKKYKDLSEGLSEEESSQDEYEEEGEEDGETETAQEDSAAGDMSAILQNYKSRNTTQMQTRSFSIPDAIQKQEEEAEESSEPESNESQDENIEEKAEVKKHTKIKPKKKAKKKQNKETKITIKTND